MWAKDLLLDLLNLQADLLRVGRVEQEACHRTPLLERNIVPLLTGRAESIDEAAENVDSLNITLSWPANQSESVKRSYTHLPECIINLLQRSWSALNWSSNITVAAAFQEILCWCDITILCRLTERGQICTGLTDTNEAILSAMVLVGRLCHSCLRGLLSRRDCWDSSLLGARNVYRSHEFASQSTRVSMHFLTAIDPYHRPGYLLLMLFSEVIMANHWGARTTFLLQLRAICLLSLDRSAIFSKRPNACAHWRLAWILYSTILLGWLQDLVWKLWAILSLTFIGISHCFIRFCHALNAEL